MEESSLKFIAIGLMSIGMFGSALGVSKIFESLLNSIARNPAAKDDLQRMAIIGGGLVEAMGLFSFVIAILIIFM